MVVGIAVAGLFCAAGGQQREVRLTGSRPVIDAARYGTIQAAIDALPKEGGVVRIPPGTFEIKKPLIVSKSDVTIQGYGTATHIKNVNTQGNSGGMTKQ